MPKAKTWIKSQVPSGWKQIIKLLFENTELTSAEIKPPDTETMITADIPRYSAEIFIEMKKLEPLWAMYMHDPRHTGYQPRSVETIYVTDPYNLWAFNPDGTLKWKLNLGEYTSWSPAVDVNGVIYTSGGGHITNAVNPDGTIKWMNPLTAVASPVLTSPAISPDSSTIYNAYDVYLKAYEPDGTVKWVIQFPDHVTTRTTVDRDVIYVATDDYYVHVLFSDGTPKWDYYVGSGVYSTPAIGPDGTIYFGSFDYCLYALNPDGTLKWKYTTGGPIAFSSPAIGPDGTIYIGTDDRYIYALNPDGTLKWKFNTGGPIVFSSPAIGPDGTIYIGTDDRYMYALNPDGSLKWSIELDGGIAGNVIGADGTIYVTTYYLGSGGTIYAINPDGTIKWSYHIGAVLGTPALA